MAEPESTTPSDNGGERAYEVTPETAEEDRPTLEPEVKPSPQPRELAQRVWGSFPRVPGTGAAPPTAPAPPAKSISEPPPPPLARLAAEPTPEIGDVEDLDDLDGIETREDVERLEDRLRATEERLTSLTQSTQQALTALGEAVHSATRDLPRAIEGVVERRLSAVGDALLKLAELRARLQEETGEAVEGIRASFDSLEDRLASATEERVDASISQLRKEIASIGERIDSAAREQKASSGGRVAELGATISERIGELPTRGDLAALRGAIGNVESLLRSELSALSERTVSIETTMVDLAGRGDARGVDASLPDANESYPAGSPAEPVSPMYSGSDEPGEHDEAQAGSAADEHPFDYGSRTEQ